MWLIKKTKPKLSKLFNDYLATKLGLATSTINITRLAADSLIAVAGDIRVSKLTLLDVEKFRAKLKEKDKKDVTVNIYCKSLSPIFNWVIKNNFAGKNLFGELGLLKIPKTKVRVLEPEEVRRLIDYCPDDYWRARVLLAITAGLRRGETINLTLNEIDFANRTITVQKKVDSKCTWRWNLKDKDCRQVPLTAETEKALLQLCGYLPIKQPYICLNPRQYSIVINKHRDGILSDSQRLRPLSNFNREFNKILKSAHINCTFYDLRRTCITQWLESGLQPHEVKVFTGHASIKTTMKSYVVTRKDLLKRASNITLIGARGLEPPTS